MPSTTGQRPKSINVRLTEKEVTRLNSALPYIQVSQAEYIRKAINEKLDRDLEREKNERDLLRLRGLQREDFHAMGESRVREAIAAIVEKVQLINPNFRL
jgi:hypothetical protein